jgi:hypothetical protein
MHSYKEVKSSAVTLTIQILSIIFSILLALSLNEWKESRNNKQLAFITLKNFRTELGDNKKAIEGALRDQRMFLNSLEDQVAHLKAGKEKALRLPEINMPDVLTTAWETALGTRAMVHIDYDLITNLSELYLQQKWLISLEDKVFQAILSPYSYEKRNAENLARSLYVSLKNIMEVEGKLLAMYDAAMQKIDARLTKR